MKAGESRGEGMTALSLRKLMREKKKKKRTDNSSECCSDVGKDVPRADTAAKKYILPQLQ